jgi:hypothetical protein
MPKPYTALPEDRVTPEPRLEKRTRLRASLSQLSGSSPSSPSASGVCHTHT